MSRSDYEKGLSFIQKMEALADQGPDDPSSDNARAAAGDMSMDDNPNNTSSDSAFEGEVLDSLIDGSNA